LKYLVRSSHDIQSYDFFFHWSGDFGLDLIVTVPVKLVFFPLGFFVWSHVLTGKPVPTFPGHAPEVLRLDGQDEGGAAGNGQHPRAVAFSFCRAI
jgi:hypothetical protein